MGAAGAVVATSLAPRSDSALPLERDVEEDASLVVSCASESMVEHRSSELDCVGVESFTRQRHHGLASTPVEQAIPESSNDGNQLLLEEPPRVTSGVLTNVKLIIPKRTKAWHVFFDFHEGKDDVKKIVQELVDANIIEAHADSCDGEGWYRKIRQALIERKCQMGAVEPSNSDRANLQFDQTVSVSSVADDSLDLHPPEDHDVRFPEQAAPENTPEEVEGQWMFLGWACANCKRLSAELCTDLHDSDMQVDICLLQRSLLYATPQEFYFKNIGEWCSNTSSAVEWFQQRHSLVGEVGIVDNECWEKLGGEVKKRDEIERKKKQEKQRANKEREIKKKNQSVESSVQLEVLLAECQRGLDDFPSNTAIRRHQSLR